MWKLQTDEACRTAHYGRGEALREAFKALDVLIFEIETSDSTEPKECEYCGSPAYIYRNSMWFCSCCLGE